MTSERRAIVLVLAAALLLLGLAAVIIWVRLSTPTDGAYADRKSDVLPAGVAVTLLRPLPNGLRDGDLVIAVAGRPLADWAQALGGPRIAPSRWQAGQTVVYTVRRGGQQLDVPVTLDVFPVEAYARRFWRELIIAVLCLLVGTFVFARRAGDPAARALLLFTTAIAVAILSNYSLGPSDFTSPTGFWVSVGTSSLGLVVVVVIWLWFTLHFPQSHPLIARHPVVVGVALVAPWLLVAGVVLLARPFSGNPLDWIWRANRIVPAGAAVYLALIVAATVSNFRRAAANPIAQRKARWVIFALLVEAMVLGPLIFLPAVLIGHPLVDSSVFGLSIGLIPVSLAIAILRSNLFDIDVILHRTLLYGGLTGTLALVYLALVVVLQQILRAATGAQSDLAIVGSTLVIAALFSPLRHRLQTFIDQRFYRQTYDAARTLAAFSAALRDEVDLSQLSQRLTAVVEETMQPTRVVVWLRPTEPSSKSF